MKRYFDHINDARGFIVERLSNDAFLGRGGNALRTSQYVLPYPPEQESYAKDVINTIIETDLKNNNVHAIKVDLYDVVLNYLDENELWDALCEAEKDAPRGDIVDMLMDTVSASGVLIPAVMQAIEESNCDLVFITGVGETFPYVRTHALLAELNAPKPVVLVFPGSYEPGPDGTRTLDILGIPSDANGGYYRASNVFDL